MSDQQLLSYSRHILRDEVGIEGQRRLLASQARIIGLGGLLRLWGKFSGQKDRHGCDGTSAEATWESFMPGAIELHAFMQLSNVFKERQRTNPTPLCSTGKSRGLN